MTKIIKILIIKLLFFLFVLNNNVFSKPLPPGSGVGDVPVNILILLDSSASMSANPFGGDSLSSVGDIVLLNDGSILVGQQNNAGIVKMDYTNEELDTDFANGKAIFYGGKPTTVSCTLEDDLQVAAVGTVSSMDKSSNVKGVTGEVIYAASYDKYKVAAIDPDGNCIEIIWAKEMGKDHFGKSDVFYPFALTIKTISGNDYLIVTGRERWCTKYKKNKKCKSNKYWKERPIMYSKNLTTGVDIICSLNDSKHEKLKKAWSITMGVTDDGNYLYYNHEKIIYRLPMAQTGGAYCPSAGNEYRYENYVSEYNAPHQIEIDPEDENIMYVTSYDSNTLQKLTFSEDRDTLTESLVVGGSEKNSATPSSAADTNLSSSIAIYRPSALFVGNDRVWTGGSKISIQEYDISGNSIKWKAEMGTARLNRMRGAQTAIEAVVTDSAFLQTANFGYGYWNAGQKYCKKTGKAKDLWKSGCESVCNKPHDYKKGFRWGSQNCQYYDTWSGAHPAGQSKNCIANSCLKVGIDKNNSDDIVKAVWKTKMSYGTDANAFSQLAWKYFNDPKVKDREGNPLINPDPTQREECQLNYVIVIGDGAWRHHDHARKKVVSLRQDLGVKTVFIAYGKDIKGGSLDKFKDMAVAGSCDVAGGDECRPLIEALTPQMLLNKLKSEVARITAARLSFTAPSITASLSEGGDLYQAQFDYAQYGEWKGSLLRKGIREDGSIIHDMAHPDNYDIADILVEQAKNNNRRIWTVMPGKDYKSDTWNWNNFVDTNWSSINSLFGTLGEVVPNYHNSSSECADALQNVDDLDTNIDDIKGLINFVRGTDYFAYGGCDNTNHIRSSVLGDIYHSQIVEVGDPKANTNFTRNNQEAYWRSINNYGTWAKSKKNRGRVIYVGANDGALHAFAAENVGEYSAGQEVWAFVPPFIAAKLPGVVNDALDGYKPDKGGTNSIFAVDGSPVIHDVYIRGLDESGDYQTVDSGKSWHTILMVTYGRGGEGFSVLDVTNPLKPYHMFSVYNNRSGTVYIADKDGNIDPHPYASGLLNMSDSLEAERAQINQNAAETADLVLDEDGDDFSNRDPIATCQSNDNITAGTGTFAKDGANACYKGKSWTFVYENFPATIMNNPSLADVTRVNEDDGRTVQIGVQSITKSGNEVTFTLKEQHVYNVSDSDDSDLDATDFSILISNQGTENKSYNYSKLGETWAAPRIMRIPSGNSPSDTIDTDNYVAVLSGGFGAAKGVGSALFLVDLEDTKTNGGSIYGAEENNGPIMIVDVNTEKKSGGVVTEKDIHNSIPTDPIVITPDTFKGVSWRGAMVYLNDFEGKITKINLTNQKSDQIPVNIFDQTTLFNLGATNTNERFSFFGMDAAYGSDTRNLWLFGATGDFSDIGGKQKGMDNILYGLRDRDFPYFRHSVNGIIPPPTVTDGATDEVVMNSEFLSKAISVAEKAPLVDNKSVCARSREDGGSCSGATKEGWVFQLDKPYDKSTDTDPPDSPNKYRKASASPTVFRGTVYYPVYEPPEGEVKCSVGKAFICSANDECGTNTSKKIAYAQKNVRTDSTFDTQSGCYYLQPGILSKLVIFGDKLFANITTDSDKQEDTLVTLLGGEGEISVYRGSWRENY
jgi:type IV pilus assembly protein PilY1